MLATNRKRHLQFTVQMRRHFENCAAPNRTQHCLSVRLDSTWLGWVRFVVSFVRGLLVLSTRFVPLRCVSLDRLLVRSFVRFLSVRVDSIIIETNLNFYEYERALRVGGSAEGEGIMWVDESPRRNEARWDLLVYICIQRMLSECPWTWRPKTRWSRCVCNGNWISTI